MLGVRRDASVDDVRSAFRRLLLQHHPDIAGTVGTIPTTQLITAYRVLRASDPEPEPDRVTAPAPPRPAPNANAVTFEGDTVAVALPNDDAFYAFLEVGHGLGEVAYVDRSVGLLETIVTFVGFPVCSVVFTFQGRANGTTEAFCTIESLSGDTPPPAAAVAALVAERLQGLLG